MSDSSASDPTDVTLPARRTTGETVQDRLTDNAYENILPARYLRKDDDGNVVEDQEDLFRRVGRNIALADAVYEAAAEDIELTVTPDQLKPDHPRRDELAAEVFGPGTEATDDAEARLTERNVNKFAYSTVVPELPASVRTVVERRAEEYTELMESLSFIPNSPCLMNAGDELQQLSACFVSSPEDDMDDIYGTLKDAATVLQSGGGMGYAFWNLRPYGDIVGSSGGIASGPITFMRSYDKMCGTIAQGGTRRGAQMSVMRISHPDVVEFIHAKNKDVSLAQCLKLNDPDDFTHNSFGEALDEARELIDDEGRVPPHLRNAVEGHLSNFNISVGVTDEFMDTLADGGEYTFTNPRTGEAHIATEHTKEMYERYGLGDHITVGEPTSLPAAVLWDRIVDGAHENGEPGVIFLDRVNDDHAYPVESTPGAPDEYEILATNPCVTGDTVIELAEGEATVAELAAEGNPRATVCRNHDRESLEFKTGVDPRKTRTDAPVVRVQTETGAAVECTPDHEIRTPTGYVEASDLDPGDEIVVKDAGGDPGDPLLDTRVVGYVEDAGTEDVYNITVSEHHNYFCRTDGRNGGESVFINVANCGEQPLLEDEACNLGHINLSTLAERDRPDWRVWEAERDEFDDMEESVEAFVEEAVDVEELGRRVRIGTRFLDNVVTMSDFPVEKIAQTVRANRKVGLGIMGLAQLYVQLGMRYGSEEANHVARHLMVRINRASKHASHDLSEVRGRFDNWEDSKYADPTAYREWFERQTGLNADEWESGYGLRNYSTTTIAPTGTTSMVGNTTGGCEPIYNVAYYKNVSDDVQGDEMLVEFDDYFMDVLEANGIDTAPVKEEAAEQMANNEFDGIDSLDTVPNAIGELFVTTGDLSGIEHAGIQCACQDGVDSAISKTCNFPNSATKGDMDEVYRYIYEHGGKGVTVYRDGTRSKQVLTTRANNAEFADGDLPDPDADPEDAAEAYLDRIEDGFGGLEAFAETEAGARVVDAATDDDEPVVIGREADDRPEYGEKRPRPDVLTGVTQRISTGYGKMYVNINEDENGRPFEVFGNIGHSGGFTNSFTEALAKVISIALRSGVDPHDLADELTGIRSPKVAWDRGEQIQSIPDAVGTGLVRYLDDDLPVEGSRQQHLTEVGAAGEDGNTTTDGGHAVGDTETGDAALVDAEKNVGIADDAETESDRHREMEGTPGIDETDGGNVDELIANGESPECPECGALTLYYSEGCKSCESCGWSEC